MLDRVRSEPYRNGDDRPHGGKPDRIFWRAEGRGLEGIGDNQLMIPPLPTINDAIGLLAALSDPEKAKALLAELKEKAESAESVLQDAQGAQRAVDEERQNRVTERDKLDKDRRAFVEEKLKFAAARADSNKRLSDTIDTLNQKQKEQEDRDGRQNAREAVLNTRELGVAKKEQQLNEREGRVVSREVQAEELMKTFAPIIEHFR